MSNGQEGEREGPFRLPRPTFGLFFPFFFGPIVVAGGRRRPPPGGGLSALPQPVSRPPPFSPPPTFPGGPASNDPIFKKALSRRVPIAGLGRLLGLGGLVITAAEVLVKVIEKRQLETMGDILAEQDRETARINIGAIARRAALEKALRVEKKVRALESAPETFELPARAPVPAPAPQRVGDVIIDPFPSQTPGVFVGDPIRSRDPLEFPDIPAPTVPRTVPVTSPVPTPRGAPFGLPTNLPIGVPSAPPIADPLLDPVGDPDLLTPTDATPVPFTAPGPTSQFAFTSDPRLQPQLNPQTDPEQRCKRRCDDRENRTQCFKGLFRESTSSIDFTDWQEVDCITGRDIESTGVSGRITSEVVELF